MPAIVFRTRRWRLSCRKVRGPFGLARRARCFDARLRLPEVAGPRRGTSGRLRDYDSMESLRVLIVEDESLIALSVEDALTDAGHIVSA
jgi:hypothetical protein